jgi:predicted nucleotidyltransferase
MPTVDVKVFYLEMLAQPPGSAGPPREGMSVLHAKRPTVAYSRFLYNTVGKDYHWRSRGKLTDEELAAILLNPLNEMHVLHLLPLRAVVGLSPPADETVERKLDLAGVEVEWVSHDLGKYLRLLVKNNGYVLEQIFSPLVVLGEDFLEELRPLARRCITRHHYHHYRGFLATQRKMLDKQEPKVVKTLLYAYRVVLTGIHLLRSGEVEANLPRLADLYGKPFLTDLIAQKQQEKIAAAGLDWAFHDSRLVALEGELDRAFQESSLPEERDREAVDRFLIDRRLGDRVAQ